MTPAQKFAEELEDVYKLMNTNVDTHNLVIASTAVAELADVAVDLAQVRFGGVEFTDLEPITKIVTKACLYIWDEFIEPFDIPRIPQPFESMIESQIRALIPAAVGSSVKKAYDAFIAKQEVEVSDGKELAQD